MHRGRPHDLRRRRNGASEKFAGVELGALKVIEGRFVDADLHDGFNDLLDYRLVILSPSAFSQQHVSVCGELLVTYRIPPGPPEEVTKSGETLLALEDATRLPALLQLPKDAHNPLTVRRRNATSLTQDRFQLGLGYILEMDLQETIPESSRENLATGVQSRRVLRRE